MIKQYTTMSNNNNNIYMCVYVCMKVYMYISYAYVYIYILCIYVEEPKGQKQQKQGFRTGQKAKKKTATGFTSSEMAIPPCAAMEYSLSWADSPLPLDYCNPQYIKVRKGYEGQYNHV